MKRLFLFLFLLVSNNSRVEANIPNTEPSNYLKLINLFNEWRVFEKIKLPKNKVLVPGVIDSTSNFVEHPEVVADRLMQFSKVIPKDQLMAGTDCGFSTFAGFGKVDENITYAKLNSLVEGANLASQLI